MFKIGPFHGLLMLSLCLSSPECDMFNLSFRNWILKLIYCGC